ncbi:hypothetical protein EJ07DRAFT_158558 [Lizonia empirigonia]|nr:hypothetical protein EJ07DRAFT_158558 [Lizonia empirigonia]
MDFNGLESLTQSALESDKSKQLAAHYTSLLSNSIDTFELQHRINARLVAAQQEILRTLLNPTDLEQSAWTACQHHKGEADELLQRFKLLTFTYYRLWPDETRCPPSARSIAAGEMDRPLHQDLKVKLAVPLPLLKQSVSVSLKPMLRFPGGGGSTGYGLGCNWLYPADLQQAEQLGDAFVCDIELPLLPESNGTVIVECLQRSMLWLVDTLQVKFESINRAWLIDWSSVSLFGASFGGGMAMLAWMTASRFRVRELVLRAPLLGEYRRDPGDYAGTSISYERASEDSLRVLETLEKMLYVLPRSGSEPPDGMWTGPMFSIAHRFLKIWKAKTVKERLLSMTVCPDKRTRIFIRHGLGDKHVDFKDTADAVKWMSSNWQMEIDLKGLPDKTHVWDAQEPLSDEQKAFFGMLKE